MLCIVKYISPVILRKAPASPKTLGDGGEEDLSFNRNISVIEPGSESSRQLLRPVGR